MTQRRYSLRPRVTLALAMLAALAGGLLPVAPATASYPGTPGRIIFLRHGDAWTVPGGGGKATQLLRAEPDVFGFRQSPDGRRVAFEAWAGQPYVMVMRRDGSNVRNVTRNVNRCGATAQPTWSPDGSRIAFVCVGGTERRRTTDIYSIRPDSTGLRRVTDVAACCIQDPAWAPRGGRIAYLSRAGVFLVPAGGGVERQLRGFYTEDDVTAAFDTLDWSPDASMLVSRWAQSIRTIDATTGDVGPDLGRGGAPVYSPDGRRIAFSDTTDDGVSKIWTMAVNGSDRRRLTYGTADDVQPDWGVRP